LSVLGCKRETPPAPPATAPRAESAGGNTFLMGGTTIDGTNVPSTNVTVRTVPR
jgi:hypothetical protein